MQELLEVQRASEEMALGQGRAQFDRRLAAAQAGKRGAGFGAARRLLSEGTEDVELAVSEWIAEHSGVGQPHAAFHWIKRAGSEQAAYITMLTVLNHLYSKGKAVKVAREISDRLYLEYRARCLKEQAPGLFEYKLPKLQSATSLRHVKYALSQTCDYAGVVVEDMTNYQRVQVGMVLLDLARLATDLFQMETQGVKKGRRVMTEIFMWPTEDTQEWLAKRNEFLASEAVQFRPLVVPPLDWDMGERGGYLFGLRGALPLVATWDQRHAEDVENASMPKVYAALNSFQRSPWRINQRVLGVVEDIAKAGGGSYDVAGRVLMDRASVPLLEPIAMPPKPHDMDTDEESARLWRREASYRKQVENTERQSKVRAFHRTVSIARQYQKHTPFFFAWTLDFRGRMYPVTDGGLSPQGDDLSRGLLEIAYGTPLGSQEAADALALHGASCLDEWNGQKVGTMTRLERLRMIGVLTAQITRAAEDPLAHTWWMEADKPLMFLAFCFEWADSEGGTDLTHPSRLMCHVDGSCNGVQHMAALMLDEATATEVNVTPNARPHDLYENMAEYARDRLSKLAVSDPDQKRRELARLWCESGLVTRKACKRPTMTFGYGGTQYGFTDQLREHFNGLGLTGQLTDRFHLEWDEKPSYGLALRLLAEVVFQGLEEVVPGAFRIREWLQTVASEATVAGSDLLKWTAPTGFPVYQRYNKTRLVQIRTVLSGGVRITPRYREVTDESDVRKHRNGIAPNYVHSLDAAHLCLTAAMMDSYPMNAVHDSFGCTAAKVPFLEWALRDAFVSLYSNNLPAKLLAELGATTPAPCAGDLDIAGVRHSAYFFC